MDAEKKGAFLGWAGGTVVKLVIGLACVFALATVLIGDLSIGSLLYQADRELVYLVDHPGPCGVGRQGALQSRLLVASHEVVADGRLIEGDPQSSVFGRRLAGFFDVAF